MGTETKEFIRADDLVRDSFTLAKQIYDSAYCPEVLVVLWRGGTPVGIVVHEFLLYKGIETEHMVVKARSYDGIGKRTEPQVDGADAMLHAVKENSRVLIVDDIFDTGFTLKRVRDLLGEKTRHVKTATLYCKTAHGRTQTMPDFYVRRTANWIVFPHELMDLSLDEIRMKDDYVHGLLV
jgi:uncharacterized protein